MEQNCRETTTDFGLKMVSAIFFPFNHAFHHHFGEHRFLLGEGIQRHWETLSFGALLSWCISIWLSEVLRCSGNGLWDVFWWDWEGGGSSVGDSLISQEVFWGLGPFQGLSGELKVHLTCFFVFCKSWLYWVRSTAVGTECWRPRGRPMGPQQEMVFSGESKRKMSSLQPAQTACTSLLLIYFN